MKDFFVVDGTDTRKGICWFFLGCFGLIFSGWAFFVLMDLAHVSIVRVGNAIWTEDIQRARLVRATYDGKVKEASRRWRCREGWTCTKDKDAEDGP